jgi:hypothetical protein
MSIGFGREGFGVLEMVTVLPVADMLSHLFCQVHIERPQAK